MMRNERLRETAVLAKLAEMPEPDRATGEGLHAITMWPTAFALTELTAANEPRIAALVKKAVSRRATLGR